MINFLKTLIVKFSSLQKFLINTFKRIVMCNSDNDDLEHDRNNRITHFD